jgi:DNA-binding NarL/FixJ family response regulator
MDRRDPNHWKAWTPGEVSTFLRLRSEGAPMKAIAKQLGRTEKAIAKKAEQLARADRAPFDPGSS